MIATLQQNQQPTRPGAFDSLSDSFGRRFSYLRLSITEQCNFRCQYCLPDGSAVDASCSKAELTLPEIELLVCSFAALGTKKVRISGGEPSLRKDLCTIIRTIKAIPGIETVALSTNGYRLKKDVRAWREAGLDQLNISIDSLDPATFALITGQDRLPDILEGLELAANLGFNAIKINTVLLKFYNAMALPDFLEFVQKRNISLRFIELMQTGDSNAFFKKQQQSASAWCEQLQQQGWQLQTPTLHAGPAREYQHPDYLGKIGFITPYSQHFCDDCNRLRVSSSGQLFLCLFAEQHQNMRPLLQTVLRQNELSQCQKPGQTPDTHLLQQWLQQQVQQKAASHLLTSQQTGATRHFAMIGG